MLVAVGPCVSSSSVFKCVLRDALLPQNTCCARVLLFFSAATWCRSTRHVCVFEARPPWKGHYQAASLHWLHAQEPHVCVMDASVLIIPYLKHVWPHYESLGMLISAYLP